MGGSRYRGNLIPGIDAERIYSRLPIETTSAALPRAPANYHAFMNDYVIMQHYSPKKGSILDMEGSNWDNELIWQKESNLLYPVFICHKRALSSVTRDNH